MARARAGRWRRAIGFASLGIVVALGAACTLLTSLDGLTGGTPASDGGAADDSPSSPTDAGGVVTFDADDASEDVALDDSAAPDASADGPFCASLSPPPLFCDDFDGDPADAAVLTAPWDQVTEVGGTVVRSPGIVTSPPLAMLVTTAGADIDLCGYKTFVATVATGQELTLAFDFYVIEADTTSMSDAVFGALELLDKHGHRWALQLEVTYDQANGNLDVNFSENGSVSADASTKYLSHLASAPLPIGAWTRVTMEVTVGAPYTAALHFDTKEVAKVDVTPQLVGGGYPEVLVGGTYAQATGAAWVVRYDDVTFDVK